MSPSILREGPYRVFFYSGDKEEPEHVHITRDNKEAKFWLNPVILEKSEGYNRAEIREIQRLIEKNEKKLLRSWHEYFDT
jgi:hypothetical protein